MRFVETSAKLNYQITDTPDVTAATAERRHWLIDSEQHRNRCRECSTEITVGNLLVDHCGAKWALI